MNSTECGGYTGKILRVDLTEERVIEESLGETNLRKFVGGVGLGAMFLYDEVPPGTGALDPENRLIMATGPLNGTRVGGAGSFCVVTKGPLTDGGASCQANGYFGAYLKSSGYDAIIFQGAAKRWLYLYIHDGSAELRDASWLKGKDTWETEDLIKQDLGKKERELSVYCIGPAGENLAKFAAIIGDRGHVAAHNGVGAVMGSKRLKAVAATRGKKEVLIADKVRLSALSKEMVEAAKKTPPFIYQWGTSQLYPFTAKGGQLPVKNLTTNIFPNPEEFSGPNYRPKFKLQWSPCWACQARHCHIVEVLEGSYSGYVGEEPEYESWAAWTSLIDQRDPGAVVMLNDTTDRLGFDVNESGWLMSFLMECYEKGIISREDTDGIEMTWGNVESVKEMLHKTAYRRGFGDVLAEGVMRAAQRIGGEALNLAVYIKKGHAPRGHDHRGRWAEILDYATSGTGTIESGPLPIADPFSPEEVANAVVKGKTLPFMDSLVVCAFATNTFAKGVWDNNPNIDRLVAILSAATGWDYTTQEAATLSYRIANLLRAFNIRQGIGTEGELPSPRYGSTPVDGPAAGKSIMACWDQMLDRYYQEMGWDRATGKPLPQTLSNLGLESVATDLWE